MTLAVVVTGARRTSRSLRGRPSTVKAAFGVPSGLRYAQALTADPLRPLRTEVTGRRSLPSAARDARRAPLPSERSEQAEPRVGDRRLSSFDRSSGRQPDRSQRARSTANVGKTEERGGKFSASKYLRPFREGTAHSQPYPGYETTSGSSYSDPWPDRGGRTIASGFLLLRIPRDSQRGTAVSDNPSHRRALSVEIHRTEISQGRRARYDVVAIGWTNGQPANPKKHA